MGDQRELTTGKFTATLVDEDGNTITSGVVTLELSIYDQDGNVINTVVDQDILNTDRGTLSAGVMTIVFEPEDHTISGDEEEMRHKLKIFYKWDSGDKQAYDITNFMVENLAKVS